MSHDWLPPPELEGALRSLHRSYKKAFAHWERARAATVRRRRSSSWSAPTRSVSKLVYDWIAGEQVSSDGEVVAHKPGNLELLSNVVDGQPLARPRTILIDSAQLEVRRGMKADFKQAAGAEIAAFKAEYRRRNPGADVDKITDEELLREVMNTVGKKGKLGEQVRCVVSVSMLTEGWDANTVTHILGVRAFGAQLLCEQVVGRGLRRRSYATNDEPAVSSRSTPTSTASRSSSSRQTSPMQDPRRRSRSERGSRCRRTRTPANHFPQAGRIPDRAARRATSGST